MFLNIHLIQLAIITCTERRVVRSLNPLAGITCLKYFIVRRQYSHGFIVFTAEGTGRVHVVMIKIYFTL